MRWFLPVCRAARTLKETPLSAARRRRLSGGSPSFARSTFARAIRSLRLQEIVMAIPSSGDVSCNTTAFFSGPSIADDVLESQHIVRSWHNSENLQTAGLMQGVARA